MAKSAYTAAIDHKVHLIDPQERFSDLKASIALYNSGNDQHFERKAAYPSVYGEPTHELWVRETSRGLDCIILDEDEAILYKARDDKQADLVWQGQLYKSGIKPDQFDPSFHSLKERIGNSTLNGFFLGLVPLGGFEVYMIVVGAGYMINPQGFQEAYNYMANNLNNLFWVLPLSALVCIPLGAIIGRVIGKLRCKKDLETRDSRIKKRVDLATQAYQDAAPGFVMGVDAIIDDLGLGYQIS